MVNANLLIYFDSVELAMTSKYRRKELCVEAENKGSTLCAGDGLYLI